MLDHMSNLTFHGDGEKDNEVKEQDRPEYWNVKDLKTLHK